MSEVPLLLRQEESESVWMRGRGWHARLGLRVAGVGLRV